MKLFFTSILLLISSALLAAEQNEAAKTLSASPLSTVNLLQTLFGLLMVLGCIVIVAWLLKRTNSFHSAANGQLKVIAGLPLGPRERAVLVQIGDKQVLLGVTPQQINTLYTLEQPIETSTDNHTATDFANKLRQMMQQKGN